MMIKAEKLAFIVTMMLMCYCGFVQSFHLNDTDDLPSMRQPTHGSRLYKRLLRNYNRHALPVALTKHKVNIRLLLRLVQLTDMDERNQIMTSFVWVRHEWYDPNLTWNPSRYGNIKDLQLPADEVWIPDTVLYNNADGDYQITIKTKLSVHHDGRVVWMPPATYKSFCRIDVTYFPFDVQSCELKFGPWSYDSSKVDYWLFDPHDYTQNMTDFLDQAADMEEYAESDEWDILKVTGLRSVYRYPCCSEEYVDITYQIKIRRKTLFYTINLVIPLIAHAMLTILVFYVPSASGEKISLSVNVLVSLTVFFLLLYDIIPPTSMSLPLISKYLLFTIILVSMSLIVTVGVLNCHFRHVYTFKMPPWVRQFFLNWLPKYLLYESPHEKWNKEGKSSLSSKQTLVIGDDDEKTAASGSCIQINKLLLRNKRTSVMSDSFSSASLRRAPWLLPSRSCSTLLIEQSVYDNVVQMAQSLVDEQFAGLADNPFIWQALKDVQFISNRYRDSVYDVNRKSDWEAVARVIDRLFLVIFTVSVTIGSLAVLAMAPALYDTTPAIG